MKTNRTFQAVFPPLLCALIFALAGWIITFFTSSAPDKKAAQRLEKLSLLQEEDRARLESYGWVDRAKGWVRIPIEQAMQLEENKLSSVIPHAVKSQQN